MEAGAEALQHKYGRFIDIYILNNCKSDVKNTKGKIKANEGLLVLPQPQLWVTF